MSNKLHDVYTKATILTQQEVTQPEERNTQGYLKVIEEKVRPL